MGYRKLPEKKNPEIKQIYELSLSDFQRYPIWVGVHNIDAGEPWYDACDEATFRPWTQSVPPVAKIGVVLVCATFKLCDGTIHQGYIRAISEDWDTPPNTRTMPNGSEVHYRRFSERYGSPLAILGLQQPKIFVHGRPFSFWGGIRGVPVEQRKAFYAATGKATDQIFPIRFAGNATLITGILNGELEGFYRGFRDGGPPQPEL
jgi:hypothetical protein